MNMNLGCAVLDIVWPFAWPLLTVTIARPLSRTAVLEYDCSYLALEFWTAAINWLVDFCSQIVEMFLIYEIFILKKDV